MNLGVSLVRAPGAETPPPMRETSPPAPLLDSRFASLGEGRQIATLRVCGLRALPQFCATSITPVKKP